jgi:hypothetical protein
MSGMPVFGPDCILLISICLGLCFNLLAINELRKIHISGRETSWLNIVVSPQLELYYLNAFWGKVTDMICVFNMLSTTLMWCKFVEDIVKF